MMLLQIKNLAFFFLYILMAKAVVNIAIFSESLNVFPIWIPAGLAFLLFLLTSAHYSSIAAIFIAASFSNFYILDNSFFPSILIGAGNTIGPFAVFLLLQKVEFKDIFNSKINTINYLVSIATGALFSAVNGSFVLYFLNYIELDSFLTALMGWFIGDVLGLIIISSIYILLSKFTVKEILKTLKQKSFIFSLVFIILFTYALVSFTHFMHLEFFVLLPLLFTTFFYREIGVFIVTLLLSLSGIAFINFTQLNHQYTILELQVFVLFAFSLGYVLASYLNQYDVLLSKQKKTNEEVIMTFANFIEQKDTYTAGHSNRVATYSKGIAKQMGLSKIDQELIYRAGVIHDIGKLVTPENILLKPGKLTNEEYSLMKMHAEVGAEIIKKIGEFDDVSKIIRHHHERVDGKGYPDSLKKSEIPLLSRIMTIADAFDAMTTNRIYKPRKSINQAIKELEKEAGGQFDENIVRFAGKYFSNIESIDASSQSIFNFSSEIENQRLAYFFKDHLTGLYNAQYLDSILALNQQDALYRCVNIIYIKNMNEYNKKFGWGAGDEFFHQFSKHLMENYPHALIFRVHGDEFIILNKLHTDIFENDFNPLRDIFNDTIKVELKHIDLKEEKLQSYYDLEKYI